MGARCYSCGEKFGRCYEHAGNERDDCPACQHTHDCIDYWLDVDDSEIA